jgi:hypothetical protein
LGFSFNGYTLAITSLDRRMGNLEPLEETRDFLVSTLAFYTWVGAFLTYASRWPKPLGVGLGFSDIKWVSLGPIKSISFLIIKMAFLDMGLDLLNTCHLGLGFLNMTQG